VVDHDEGTKERLCMQTAIFDPPAARVAVVTRTKDRPLLLERAMQSLADQTFGDSHWVVVNDGGASAPVDRIVERARAVGLRTTVVHHPVSLGMEAASNAGIAAAASEFVAIHDDDDSWDPEFLAATVAFLDTGPQWGGVVTGTLRVDERLGPQGAKEVRRRPFNPGLRSVHLSEVAEENPFPPICFLYRRSAYESIGPYDASLPVLGDWEFNLRFLTRFDIGVIDRPLANYHWRVGEKGGYGNSVSGGVDRHVQWDAVVRNRLLRRDIEAGTVGLGHLVAAGRRQTSLNKTLQPLRMARGAAKRIVHGLRRVAGAA
jgi:glycosyltransferase involved in cell wall biosynthesis